MTGQQLARKLFNFCGFNYCVTNREKKSKSNSNRRCEQNSQRLFFSAAADKCGGNVRISSANYLTSPGYPKSYPPSQRCTWVISAPGPHQRILINFNPHFDLEDRECKWVAGWFLCLSEVVCLPAKKKIIIKRKKVNPQPAKLFKLPFNLPPSLLLYYFFFFLNQHSIPGSDIRHAGLVRLTPRSTPSNTHCAWNTAI